MCLNHNRLLKFGLNRNLKLNRILKDNFFIITGWHTHISEGTSINFMEHNEEFRGS